MQADTGIMTILEQHVEESKRFVLTQCPTEVLSEVTKEGCEPTEDNLNIYTNDGTIYYDTVLYDTSAEEEEEREYDDGDNEDEGTAYDDTQAYEFTYENDVAIEGEEQDEDSWSTPGPEISYEYPEYFTSCPPKVLYAFLRHTINECEASFHRLVQYHFGEDLKSEKWRQNILTDNGVGRLASRPWDQAHAVEVKDWIKLLECVRHANLLPENALADPETFSPKNLTPAFQMLRMAEYIRNATFHRDGFVILSQLKTALQIPRVLKDGKKSDELEAMHGVIVNDPELNAPSSDWVRNILFPPQLESGTCLDVHAKILSVLEEGSFYFAQREDCQFLAQRCWTDPELGEMQIYAYHWENTPGEYQDSAAATKPEECADLDRQFFLHPHLREAVMSIATSLRNSVAHRDLLNDRSVCYCAWNAILCFILMGDRILAIEIESLAEAFLTKTSQTDALLRLHNASWDDDPARRHAIVEVCRREGIRADGSDSPKRKPYPVSPQPCSDIRSRWAETSKSAKAKRSLTDDEKMELWDSAVQRFVFCASMHEMLMREHPVE